MAPAFIGITFLPTIENLVRWQWSIGEAEKRAERETEPFNMPNQLPAKCKAQSRAVGSFGRLPGMMRAAF